MVLKNHRIEIRDLGLCEYRQAWDLQKELFARVTGIKKQNKVLQSPVAVPNYLLRVEHPHVYTMGRSGHDENLLVAEETLLDRGIPLFRIERGGDITYHGPGQVVFYPILDLENFFTDIHRYMRTLEEAVILTLADYGLRGERSPGETGVWIDPEGSAPRKICAMGVRCSGWVTMHGLALNVNTDLSYFRNIVPCGIKGKGVTSMEKELGGQIPIDSVKQALTRHFMELFSAEVR